METPDGKEFKEDSAKAAVRAAANAPGAAAMMLLRAVWKLIITTWRLAAALDSALWRATKLLFRKAVNGIVYVLGLALAAFQSLLLWLPTRTGRAYSAVSGVMLAVASLWIIDELRAGPGADLDGQARLRAPIDEEDPILARIEGRYVHLSEIEAAARAGGFLREGETLTPQSAFQRELVQSYVEQRLLARAALDEGLQRTPRVLRRVNAARDRVLAAAYLDAQIEDAVKPDTVRRLYDSQKDVTAIGDQVRARHILVATGEEAEAVIAQLNEGAEFGALAREKSLDRATAPLGGEVGWFSRDMMARDFARVAFSTPVGEIAAPFQTEFGWHIIKVLDRRGTQAVPFSDVRANIAEFLRLRAIDRTLRKLEDESQVVYFMPDENAPADSPAPPDLDAPDLLDVEGAGEDGASD
ncbi:MAG: peptidylprolyl isomerase [Hyphococcus sp.]